MKLKTFYRRVIVNGMEFLKDEELINDDSDTINARVLLTAIALQESGDLKHRRQVGGPARGWWQFEAYNAATESVVRTKFGRGLCEALAVKPVTDIAHAALEHNDLLAFGFARRLLIFDPQPIPDPSDIEGTYSCYTRNWRPGKEHPEAWPERLERARIAAGDFLIARA